MASTVDPELRKELNDKSGNIEAAKIIGNTIAKKALEKGINQSSI